jgi:hypothetical protein
MTTTATPTHVAHRRAKIVCTLGPATEHRLADLIVAGMDVARLIFSHGNQADHQRVYCPYVKQPTPWAALSLLGRGARDGPVRRCRAPREARAATFVGLYGPAMRSESHFRRSTNGPIPA